MAADITDENPPPCVGEQYSTAVGASNLRVQADRRSSGDMIIAAGMNTHRLGMALRRLATEWDVVGKPPPICERNLEAMAAKYPRLKGTGLVLVISIDRKGQTICEELIPLVAAKREADKWHAHELGLLFQRLKTLPEVRAALVYWAAYWGMQGPEHVVGSVLQWCLAPVCQVCQGVKKRVVAGTGRTGSKNCRECRGMGERKVPHGTDGRRVLGYINECQRASVKGLRDKFRHSA